MQEKYEKLRKERLQQQEELEARRLDDVVKLFIDYHTRRAGLCTLIGFCKFAEISESFFKNRFGSIKEIYGIAREKYPDTFSDIAVEDFVNIENQDRVRVAVKNSKVFFITTAVGGDEVLESAFKTAKLFCKLKKAELLIQVCHNPANAATQKGGYGTIDKILQKELIITEDIQLNSNLYICSIQTTAKQVNPATGLARIGQINGSFIYASPKQMLKLSSVSNTKLPHAIMTTGAITKPNYHADKYMSKRTDYIADNDHKLGALIVEVEDDQVFHFRQVQFDENGSFCDMGKMYSVSGVKNYSPAAIIPGDWHSGETDPQVSKAVRELIIKLRPEKVIIHDVFNSMSVNPFEEFNDTLKCRRAEAGKLDIKAEIEQVALDLNMFAKMVKEVVVVKSNHDEMLTKYLSAGKYQHDHINLRIGLQLSLAMLEGRDPLQEGVAKSGMAMFPNIRWLRRDEDYKIAGIECGAHGDKGPNGSRGNLTAMENSYGKSVTGHSHTPGIQRDAWAVGTSSYLQVVYNIGPSSWLQTLCIVYKNGQRQLINIIEGKYTIK